MKEIQMAQTVDFSVVLKDIDGTPLTETQGKGEDRKEVELTLAKMCARALFYPKQQPEPGDKKAERGRLAFRIYDAEEMELESNDIVLIKQCVGEFLSPLVVTQVYDLLK